MSRLPDESKKRRILDTAFHLFGSIGYKSTTIKMVAEKSGIAPGSVYTYFQSKKNLYRQTSRYIWQVLTVKVDNIIYSSLAFDQKVIGLSKLGIDMLNKASFLLLGIFETPSRRKFMKEHIDRTCWRLLPIFKSSFSPKHLREGSAESTVYFIKNYITGTLFQYLLLTETQEKEIFIKQLWNEISRDLSSPKDL